MREGMIALDFGCGPGFLLRRLLESGLHCHGVDASPKEIDLVNEKFSGSALWKGGNVAFSPPLPFPDASFDLIVCVEVLEHLLPDMEEAIPREILRLLKPKGRVLFTTPNNENLDERTVYCPFCDTRFHRRQHLRSLNASDVASTLQGLGYKTVFCEGLDFQSLQSRHFKTTWKSWNMRFLVSTLRLLNWHILDMVHPKPFPNGRVFRARSKCGSKAPHLCILAEKS
jgi:SAM-dependent methyltransferase